MENFEPRESEIIRELKHQMMTYIRESSVISKETKNLMMEELDSERFGNSLSHRFEGTNFLNAAVGHSIRDWREQNLKLAELWKNIAINNAKVNNEPHLVADEAVARFRDEFDAFEY